MTTAAIPLCRPVKVTFLNTKMKRAIMFFTDGSFLYLIVRGDRDSA